MPVDIPPWSWAYWIPLVIFDTTLFLLSLWKTVAIFAIPPASPPRILVVLLKDSFVYFGGVMLWSIANFVAWYYQPVSPVNYFCRFIPFTGALNSPMYRFLSMAHLLGRPSSRFQIPNIQHMRSVHICFQSILGCRMLVCTINTSAQRTLILYLQLNVREAATPSIAFSFEDIETANWHNSQSGALSTNVEGWQYSLKP